jgi:hypothetical protein
MATGNGERAGKPSNMSTYWDRFDDGRVACGPIPLLDVSIAHLPMLPNLPHNDG